MHLQSKLHENSILTGSVDNYCLVCDNYLRSEDDAFTHAEKPIHRKNIGAATRVEKFSDDRIIKVTKGYYCPFCNILLSTTTKVAIHIGNVNHQDNKRAQMLRRIGDNIIAFDEVAITLESWHGLIDGTCVICNMEFEEDGLHKTDLTHLLRLVQSKCEFGDKFVYRKVDEDSFFCLICAGVFSINEKLTHHENTSHKMLYNSGKEMKKKLPLKTITTKLPPKPESTISNGTAKGPVDDKHTHKVDTKKTKTKVDRVDPKTSKPEVGPTLSPDRSPTNLKDGKLKTEFSTDVEISTLLKNAVLVVKDTDINENTHENVNGAVENKKESAGNQTSYIEKQSDILDRVDEFQKKGINIDFSWDRARCTRCDVYVPFNVAAIEDHIKNQHAIKQTDIIVANQDLKMQTKKLDANDLKTDTKETENVELNKDIKKIDNGVETKPDTKKHVKTNTKQTVNGVEPKTDTKKTDNIIEPKTDTKKIDNHVIAKPAKKKQPKQSENITDVKTNTKQTNGVESRADTKKLENRIEPKTDIMKTDSRIEPKIDKVAELKANNKIELKATTKDQKKSDNDPKPDTRKKLEMLANENNMVVMANNVYCPLCKVGITMTMAAIKAHVDLRSHKDQKADPNEKKVQMSEFMDLFLRVESNLGSDIVLNNKYVLRQHSFHCIVMEGDGYKCMVCDSDFTKAGGQLNQHMNGPDHKINLGLCNVLTSLPEEFIREINSDKYHCGYCNEVLNSWIEMQDHLSRLQHIHARRHAMWNFERCRGVIRNARLMQVSTMHAINYA